MKTPKPSLLFFTGLLLLYLSLSPGAVLGMGYTAENVNASNQIISNLGDWLAFRPAAINVSWPRHGLFELLFEIPFLLLARLFFGASPEWADRILSIQPVVITSLICTLVFIWVRRITGSLTWSYVLALAAAFSTMLWPYAYIGLETTQSLFLLLSGYLALGSGHRRTWPHAVFFALSCGMAVSLKSNSIFLAPTVAFLYFVYTGSEPPGVAWRIVEWRKASGVAAIIVAMYGLNAYTRSLSPTWASGTLSVFKLFNVDGPLTVAFNIVSLFGSVNKGLFIYCPIVIICLLGLGRAYRKNARVVIFASLTLGGLAAGCSLFYFYADETWGPRYLHSAVAPLIICLALTRESIRFRLRRELPLLALTFWGAAVSFLGAFYYYGAMHLAATQSGQATIETLQTDPNWNHIRFNLMLLQVWRRGGVDAVPWTPARHWWFEQPPDATPLKTINLRDFATPQPSLVRGWALHKEGYYQVIWYSYLVSLCSGTLVLISLGLLVSRNDARSHRAKSQAGSELVSTPTGED